jgi:metallo-beta-lactamase family protein
VKLQLLGATRQVTGSQYYVEADETRILVDCGMFQEREYLGRNWEPSPVPPAKIDAVLLTHAHLDHCGLAPKLVREGFRGPIMATAASADLAALVLRDSAEIQAEDAAYKKKRHRREGRKGKYPVKPLYTAEDVARTLPLFQRVAYEQEVQITDGVAAVFHDAGHILGSAMVELRARQNSRVPRGGGYVPGPYPLTAGWRRLVFSGDLGQPGKPLVRDPAVLAEADLIVMESTYGNRDHEDHGDVESQLAEVINRTVRGGGNVVIPIFAIERSQELIYHLSRLRHAQRIPPVPVFLDSPMAADVTEVFRRHPECFDLETWQLITSGDSPLSFPGLTMARSVDDSKAINDQKGPVIIASTSGMCTAGRIKFHLRRNITRPESTILFVGYQARGTLGRQILDGNPEVRIHGRHLPVKARVEQIHGFSGHADRSGLLRWLRFFRRPPQRLLLTHGEEEQALGLAEHVRQELGWEVSVPEYQQVVELA